jgi:RimJ/RimL family protein N-acetyltransferase
VNLSDLSGETERMSLRPYRLSDYVEFADLHGREEVARYLPWEPRDADASRAALERHVDMSLETDGDGITLAGLDKVTGRLVGEFVLFLRSVEHRGGELGYILHPAFQGRGLATEGARAVLKFGFEGTGMHRIVARIDARNVASAAVLTRLGLRKEAHLVKNELFQGEWSDEADYAMLAEEWSSNKASSAISWKTTAPAPASVSAGQSPPANP